MRYTYNIFRLLLLCGFASFSQESECIVDKADLNATNAAQGLEIEILNQDNNGKYSIRISNNDNTDMYLFSSYFNEDISNSKYFSKIDRRKKELKQSYLPMIPFLSYAGASIY